MGKLIKLLKFENKKYRKKYLEEKNNIVFYPLDVLIILKFLI